LATDSSIVLCDGLTGLPNAISVIWLGPRASAVDIDYEPLAERKS
jgi:hypothetical protein